jgi:hypothetical protein
MEGDAFGFEFFDWYSKVRNLKCCSRLKDKSEENSFLRKGLAASFAGVPTSVDYMRSKSQISQIERFIGDQGEDDKKGSFNPESGEDHQKTSTYNDLFDDFCKRELRLTATAQSKLYVLSEDGENGPLQ